MWSPFPQRTPEKTLTEQKPRPEYNKTTARQYIERKGWHKGAACSIAASQLHGLILSSGWIGDSKLLLGMKVCEYGALLMDYWPTQGLFPPYNQAFTKALTRIKWLLQMNKWIPNKYMVVCAKTWVFSCAGSITGSLAVNMQSIREPAAWKHIL